MGEPLKVNGALDGLVVGEVRVFGVPTPPTGVWANGKQVRDFSYTADTKVKHRHEEICMPWKSTAHIMLMFYDGTMVNFSYLLYFNVWFWMCIGSYSGRSWLADVREVHSGVEFMKSLLFSLCWIMEKLPMCKICFKWWECSMLHEQCTGSVEILQSNKSFFIYLIKWKKKFTVCILCDDFNFWK